MKMKDSDEYAYLYGGDSVKKSILVCILLMLSLLLCGCDNRREPPVDDTPGGVIEAWVTFGDAVNMKGAKKTSDEWYRDEFEIRVGEEYQLWLKRHHGTICNDYVLGRSFEITYDESVMDLSYFYGEECLDHCEARYRFTVKREVEQTEIYIKSLSEHYKDLVVVLKIIE